MNRALILTATAVAALSLAACSKHGGNTADNTAAATNASDSGNAAGNMSTGSTPSPTVNKAEDTVGAAVGATSAATLGSHDTGAFVDNLAQGNEYEIQAAKIAETKAKSPDVKAFAKMMVTDHTKLGTEAKPVIAASGKTPPTGLDKRRSGFLDNLNSAPADQFDKTYIDQQVAAHQETLTMLQGYAKDGSDAGLKGLAQKAAPVVQHHLDRAQALQAKLGGGGSAGASGNSQ